ncbi:uncharacterized protein LOC119723530 [Patiria miniata]|uniref:Uncharacterized protein n=1 Tax=Patiria miniata TaxID=46514 RepID=A0A913ZEE3_PATMI|nr:uncharacterized protein LOC119723530 [Patiria miniata]
MTARPILGSVLFALGKGLALRSAGKIVQSGSAISTSMMSSIKRMKNKGTGSTSTRGDSSQARRICLTAAKLIARILLTKAMMSSKDIVKKSGSMGESIDANELPDVDPEVQASLIKSIMESGWGAAAFASDKIKGMLPDVEPEVLANLIITIRDSGSDAATFATEKVKGVLPDVEPEVLELLVGIILEGGLVAASFASDNIKDYLPDLAAATLALGGVSIALPAIGAGGIAVGKYTLIKVTVSAILVMGRHVWNY